VEATFREEAWLFEHLDFLPEQKAAPKLILTTLIWCD
jgi:hypothetical protein